MEVHLPNQGILIFDPPRNARRPNKSIANRQFMHYVILHMCMHQPTQDF
jgi:hypothetical protein